MLETEYLKGKGQSSTSSSYGAQRSGLGGHAVHSPHSHCTPEISDCIKVGSFYEIDHTKLSPKAQEQLKSIRVVMVNEKTPLKVSLRFPSIYSLSKHLKDGSGCNPYGKKLPALDDKYLMGVNRAVEVLSRRIPPQELAEQRNSWGFWSGPSAETSSTPSQALNDGVSFVVPKKGCCWSELKGTGMVQWGKRRQVRFLRRHEETNFEGLSSDVKAREEGEEEKDEEREKDDRGVVAGTKEEEEDDDDEEEENMEDNDNCDDSGAAVREPKRETRSSRKRKRHGSTRKKKAKKVKRETQNQIQVYQSKRKMVKNSIDRWSADRYKLAEQNMLKILKAKGAVFWKPILRPALRAEARKLIGDTGLLDHLLKHMAGKVAPGGAERFRRRHNADGAMEYWLESADLVNIRKEAGVQDPYWTPPPGWQLGDNPAMDPVCARELRELKEEMAIMKREMQELVSKKEEEKQAIVVVPPSSDSNNLKRNKSLILLEQEMHAELVRMKAKVEQQLVEISQACMGSMKEMMERLKHEATMKDPSKSEWETITKVTSNDDETKGEKGERGKREKEDRAAKIERLKSGFRICKPQGTFLWPDMGMPPQAQVVFQLVPTPPSASSSTAPQPVAQRYGPSAQTSPPPLKPLAERRAVPMAAVSSVLTGPLPSPPPPPPPQGSVGAATNTSLINLNEVPMGDSNTAVCGTHNDQLRPRHQLMALFV